MTSRGHHEGSSDRAEGAEFVRAIAAPPPARSNPLTRSLAGVIGIVFLAVMLLACLGSLPWTLGAVQEGNAQIPRYNAGDPSLGRIGPMWWPGDAADPAAPERDARFLLGSDHLGRSVLVRALAGGGISLGIGVAAALISVAIGTIYGAVAGYWGGKLDAVLMRIVDVLYGLPYVLLVVLLAVASDAVIDEWVTRSKARASWVADRAEIALVEAGTPDPSRDEISRFLGSDPGRAEAWRSEALVEVPPRQLSSASRTALDVLTLLIAIGGVSWLTMARVVRGQVLSLKNQPFVEAARAVGAPTPRIFLRHLLPNLLGPITVYATLTVPQAILQKSFLSFLGIGVKPPLPSWGNLTAEGLSELNTYRSHWWLLLVPSSLLGVTLLALNFVGEGLREALDPKRSVRA